MEKTSATKNIPGSRTVNVKWTHTLAGPERITRVVLIDGYSTEIDIPKIIAITHLRGGLRDVSDVHVVSTSESRITEKS